MRSDKVVNSLPELYQLDRWAQAESGFYRVKVLTEIRCRGDSLPVYRFELGSGDPRHPTVVFLGGVHGIERIGTQVLLSYMHTLFQQLQWDDGLNNLLNNLRVVFIPLVNPGGMLLKRRANPNGVDLMRNAPLDGEGKVSFMLGGHRFSRRLPWFRGRSAVVMEPEAEAVRREITAISEQTECLITLDCHSGFGRIDRIWFPFAYTPDPFDNIGDVFALRLLFRRTHPNFSFYRIEPQSHQYTTHGDLWDYLYLSTRARRKGIFLPLTLEMGSWLWVKKNPRQIFGTLGMFNPMMPHRHERVLRRHQTLFDFLLRAANANKNWLPGSEEKREWMNRAIDYWYQGNPG